MGSATSTATRPLMDRMVEDMRLRGLAARTQQSYRESVAGLAKYMRRTPDELATLTEEDVRRFFLHLMTERHAARGTVIVARSGIRFLFETTLGHEWEIFDRVRPPKRYGLPVVLARDEVRDLLGRVRDERARMCLTLIYSCGLRLSEGLRITTADIDSQRMMLRVHHGKGDRDR